MPDINLLPQELKPKGYVVKASKSLKRFSVLTLVVLFLGVTIFLASNIFFSLQKRNLANRQQSLTQEIKALEQTEQKLVLISDRLLGISKINAGNSAGQELNALQTVIEKNPQNIVIERVKLDKDKLVLSISAGSSSHLTSFYSLLLNSNFSLISLESFNFTPNLGYRVDIAIGK